MNDQDTATESESRIVFIGVGAMALVVFALMIATRMGVTIHSVMALTPMFTRLAKLAWAVAVLVLLVLILRRLPPREK